MISRKETLIKVFEDTQQFYQENQILAVAVSYGRKHTKLYAADDYPELPVLGTEEGLLAMADNADGSISVQAYAYQQAMKIREGAPNDPVQHKQEIRVTKDKTFEAAMKLHREFPDKKIAVLNFASATRPGGGVKSGSSAQEESLCRCSTLFPTLDRRWLWKDYYDVNRASQDVCHSDACIYSPGVIICKTDESIPQRMNQESFVTVDVISCAAPNLRNEPANYHNPETGEPMNMDPNQLREIHMKRARHILHVAADNKVDILVLGAFGCGAFANDPRIVAQAYRMVLGEYLGRFDLVEFAIYCRDQETDNYKAFFEQFRLLMKDNEFEDASKKKDIHEFALKYYQLFQALETEERAVHEGFADQCFAIGFEMDCGYRFISEYSSNAFYDCREFKKIVGNIDNIRLLGSAIFSHWRYVTHWADDEKLLDADNREWFITAFARLVEITKTEG